MTATASPATTNRGRPRDPTTDDAILAATLRCLARGGYARMSIGDIAKEAGTTRPTIYRRWRTKEELAMAAIGDLIARDATDDTDDTRAGLTRVLDAMYRALIVQKRVTLFGGMFTEVDHNPLFVELFRVQILRPRQDQIAHLLIDGQKRGTVRRDLDVDVTVSLIMGTIPARYMNGDMVPADWPERVMASLWPTIAA